MKQNEDFKSYLVHQEYEKAVDIILGKPGSNDDIAGTDKLGLVSLMGRKNLIAVLKGADPTPKPISNGKTLQEILQILKEQGFINEEQ